jgi:hypothetical protein
MNTLGTKKDTDVKEDFRQFVINCLGENDRRKYFVISEFGSDYNAPDETKVLTADSQNKDNKFTLGFLNGLKFDDLEKGEKAIFSTSEDGSGIVAKIVFRNTGDMEINKDLSNGNILIKADGTIEFNGNADTLVGFTDLKTGFDQLKTDFNNLVTAYNSHMHPTAGTGPPSPPTMPGTSSTASIDASEKENLKSE